MSLKILQTCYFAPIRSPSLVNVARLKTSYSQTSCTRDQARSRQDEDDGANGEHDSKKSESRKGRASTRILASFAIGVPLGWAISTVQSNRKGAKAAAAGDFVKYTLVDKEYISPTSSVFRLHPTTDSVLDFSDPQWEHAITSVEFKQPQLQIARWYTLLPRIADQEEHELRFLIRKEQNGEVSGYLHRLPIDSEIELRGPSAECVLPDDVEAVLFLAGGTGIAPAMQVAADLVGRANVKVLWANRRREDCVGATVARQAAPARSIWNPASWLGPSTATTLGSTCNSTSEPGVMVAQLQDIQQSSTNPNAKITVDYFIDEEGSFIRPEQVAKLLQTLRNKPQDFERSPTAKLRRVIFVSGPQGFVNYWAGPKRWINGHEVQGPVAGVLASLDLKDWDVVKL